MASTFGIFEAAKSGLSTTMQHMKITGHNIANANTEGYTRQRLVTSAKKSSADYLLRPVTRDNTGQGVEVLKIQQLRSQYLDNQYRDLRTGYSYSERVTQALTYLEGLFNAEMNEGEGLTGAIEDFFGAFNTFSSDTTSEENRISVQKTALGLTQSFQMVYGEMQALWHDQNDSIVTISQEINAIAVKLAELNTAIGSYERSGQAANDLRDEQNLLLDKLSGYVNITCVNSGTAGGMVDVKIGGLSLVTGSACNAIEINSEPEMANTLVLDGEELSVSSGRLRGGELYGCMEMVSSLDSGRPGIPYYMDKLDCLARQLAQNINDLHLTGYSYDTDKSSAATTSRDGIYFFHVDTDTDEISGDVTAEHYDRVNAGNFSISRDIMDSVWNIAGSSVRVYSDGAEMASGNGEIANIILKDLADSGYYGSVNGLVGHLAISLDTSRGLLDTKQSLMNSVDTQRTSISGVSLDEETSNLIIFQQSYSASARMVTTIDEMLDVMINKMGLVGR